MSSTRKRTHDPVVDLELFRIKTFRIGNVGGTVCRIGYASTPFLLPLLLQLALGYSAFRSGLFTSITAVGSIAMRTITPTVLRRFGFRAVLVVNGTAVAVLMMGLALISVTTPPWALAGFLLVLGFFRSLQFTALSSLGYADLVGQKISPGSSLASVMQQLSQSFGIAICATLLGHAGGAGGPAQRAAIRHRLPRHGDLPGALHPMVRAPRARRRQPHERPSPGRHALRERQAALRATHAADGGMDTASPRPGRRATGALPPRPNHRNPAERRSAKNRRSSAAASVSPMPP